MPSTHGTTESQAPAATLVQHVEVLGVRIDATSYGSATSQVIRWAEQRLSRYVCCANVHVVMEAQDSRSFAQVLRDAALVTPDGMPLVWYLRGTGITQERVYGPDLMLHICEAAACAGIPIGLFGGNEETLRRLKHNLQARFPHLTIPYAFAPPYRPMTHEEDAIMTGTFAESGARILFVGLGCPKQELWMAAHRERVPAVMLGVGAAFDFHAGTVRQAPPWMQASGLEWLFRLSREPRRLASRYARHNPRFVLRALPALARRRVARGLGRAR